MKAIFRPAAVLYLFTLGWGHADEISVAPTVFDVGKWPEEIGLIENHLWVAESGQRSLAKLEASSGKKLLKVECGRLPVNLEAFGEMIYATINTDAKIWKQGNASKGSAIVSTGADYPQGLAITGDAIFVLLNLKGSDAESVVMRIESDTYKTRRSISVGARANNVVAGEGSLWVLRTDFVGDTPTGIITHVDPETLEVQGHAEVEGWIDEGVISGGRLFVSGGSEEAGRITVCNVENGKIEGSLDYPGTRVVALVATDEHLVSVDTAGAVHVHRLDTLAHERTIHLKTKRFDPKDLCVTPDSIYVSAHLGDIGAVYKIDEWMPGNTTSNPEPAPGDAFLLSESLGGIPLGLSEADLTRQLGLPEKRGDAIANEVAGGFLVELSWPSKGLVVMMASEEKGTPGIVDSVRIEGSSDLVTAAGIGIGASLAEVRKAYGKHEDKVDSPVPDPAKGDFVFVAGSIYGGVILGFENSKVASILLGAGAE